MPAFKVGPKCCCGCRIFYDEFAATLDSAWNQIAGSWSTSANQLVTSNTSGMLIHDTAQVPGTAGRIVVTDPSANGAWKIIAAIDDDNYIYIQFTALGGSNWNVKLGYFAAGAETVLQSQTSLDQAAFAPNTPFSLCWDGSRIYGGTPNMSLSGDYAAPANLRPGFATGATGTTWSFGSLELLYHISERSSCPSCGSCWDLCETFPDTIEVYIPAGMFTSPDLTLATPGGGGTTWGCNGNCENLNDQTFVLTKTADGDVNDEGYGRTGCPLYEYEEEDFCDIEHDTIGGSYPATLTIRARFLAGPTENGRIEVLMHIRSACNSHIGGGGCPGSYGNTTTYSFNVPLQPLQQWGVCDEGEHDTDPLYAATQTCISRHQPLAFPFGGCNASDPACDVDPTKFLTIAL